MVRCEQAESPALSAFLDGALPDEEQVALSAHLEGCRDCAAELAQLRGLDEALAGAVDADAGHEPGDAYWESFPQRVMERALSENPAVARPGWWRLNTFPVGAVSTAAAVLLILVIHGALRPQGVPAGLPTEAKRPAPRRVEPAPSGGLLLAQVAELRRELRRLEKDHKEYVAQLERDLAQKSTFTLNAVPDTRVEWPSDQVLLSAVEVALIQLSSTRTASELEMLQACLKASKLTERLRKASRQMAQPERLAMNGLCQAFESVLKVSATGWERADLSRLLRDTQVDRLHQQLAQLKRRGQGDRTGEVSYVGR